LSRCLGASPTSGSLLLSLGDNLRGNLYQSTKAINYQDRPRTVEDARTASFSDFTIDYASELSNRLNLSRRNLSNVALAAASS
jgi:hypothetical protein